eukprot:1016785-Alexandrium_andersonii.AAC.1
MEAVCNQADVAGRTVRGRGPVLANVPQRRIDDNWAEPVSEAGAAIVESYLSEADEMVTCAGCRCGATTVYFVPRKDGAD